MRVTAFFQEGLAMATPHDKFKSKTIGKGQFGEFQAFNQFIPPVNGGNIWLSLQKTKGLSDGYVLNNVWQPGGTTGWHTHLSHTLVIVTAGAVTQYQGDRPPCTGTREPAWRSFVDEGSVYVDTVTKDRSVRAQFVDRR